MIIQQHQMRSLQSSAAGNFEKELVKHVSAAFPRHCASMTPAAVEQKVRLAMAAAMEHKFTSQNAFQLSADLSFLFGCGFFDDPLLPWVAPALAAEGGEPARVEELFRQSTAYLETVTGPDGAHVAAALDRVRMERLDDLPDPLGDQFAPRVARRLSAIYPERFKAAGVEGVKSMMTSGQPRAEKHGFRTGPGAGLYLALMFLLGSSFDRDPQFAPIAAALGGDPAALHRASLDYLQRF